MSIKHALITGAAKRVGRSLALHLADAGWDISIHYHTSREEAEELRDEIERKGRSAQIFQADLANEIEVGRLLPKNADKPVTALIHNASCFQYDTKDPDGSGHIAVNYIMPLLLNEKFKEQLPRDQFGSILHFLDNTAIPDFMSGYTRSRELLQNDLSKLALQYAPRMSVNALALGPTLRNERQSEAHFKALVEETPLQHATSLDDIAGAALHLLHTRSITGQILNIDSGMHLIR